MHDTVFIFYEETSGAAAAHIHCFCLQDTAGNWVCCKCGMRRGEPYSNPIMTTAGAGDK